MSLTFRFRVFRPSLPELWFGLERFCLSMDNDDSSSEDEDYKPTTAEVDEAEAYSKGQKRKRTDGEAGLKVISTSVLH